MNIAKFKKNIFYSFNSNIISLFLGVLATIIFPKFLNVSGYGYYQLYIFYCTYASITSLGISDGMQLEIAGKDYSEIDFKKHNSIFIFSLFTQFIVYITFIIYAILSFNDNTKQKVFILSCISGLIIQPYCYLRNILQATDRLKKYSYIVITERSISIVISIIAILLGCRNFIFMIVFDIIGRFISLVLAISYCPEIVCHKPKINKKIVKNAIAYVGSGIMILFAMQTSGIVIGINRYGIEHFWGIEHFSKISLAIALSNMALRCVNSVSVVMFPTLRNVDIINLPYIYKKINISLMSFIFICMCFFKPICYFISLWLPQYADTLKYSVLLLPICVYECKYSLLINTNLKNLNKEKIIGFINLISVMMSIVTAIIFIFFLRNIELSMIGILISLSIRSIIGEFIIGKLFKIKVIANIFSEMFVSLLFIICNYYIGTTYSALIYSISVIVYLIFNKHELYEIIKKIRTK